MTQNSCQIKPRCVEGLLPRVGLTGVLFGLKTLGQELEIDAKMFPCCEGSGQSFLVEQRAVQHCSLPHRLARTRAIWEDMRQMPLQANADQILKSLNDYRSHQVLATVEIWLGSHSQGFFLKPASEFCAEWGVWPYALACAWRFACPVQVFHLGKSIAYRQLVHSAERVRKAPTGKKAFFFVHGLEKLTDPAAATELELIVSEAYHTNTTLVICGNPPVVSERGTLTRDGGGFFPSSQMRRKVQKLKQDWLPMLEPDCRSKMAGMFAEFQ